MSHTHGYRMCKDAHSTALWGQPRKGHRDVRREDGGRAAPAWGLSRVASERMLGSVETRLLHCAREIWREKFLHTETHMIQGTEMCTVLGFCE